MSKLAKTLAIVLTATIVTSFLQGMFGIYTTENWDMLVGLLMIISGVWLSILVLKHK